jgi:hypothetical protein
MKKIVLGKQKTLLLHYNDHSVKNVKGKSSYIFWEDTKIFNVAVGGMYNEYFASKG